MHVARCGVYVLVASAAVWAQSITIDVPATGNLWLAGAVAGTVVCCTGDTAPLNSPVLAGLAFRPGEQLSFNAAGVVQGPEGSSGPNGGRTNTGGVPANLGLSGVNAPLYGLLGVFTGESIAPDAPTPLDFSGGTRDLTVVSPFLQQVFYIGQGQNTLGETKKFTAPVGATRLYLAIYPGGNAFSGEFSVTVSIADLRGYFPQVADGGSWRTTFTLLNTGAQPAQYRLKLYQDNGADFALPRQAGSAPLEGTIPVGGSVDIISLGYGPDVAQGWAVLSGSPNIDGVAVFRQQVPNRPDFEGAVLLTHSERELLLPFDQTPGFSTGLAIGNPEPALQTFVADFTDDQGLPLGTSILPVVAFGHTAFDVASPAAPAGVPTSGKGVMRIRAQGTQRVVLLGLRFKVGGAFTSLPVLKPQ